MILKWFPKIFILPLFVFTSLVFFVSSCKNVDKDRYYNKKYDFSIKFPRGWIVKENEKETTVMAVMPEYSKNEIFNENINIVINTFQSAPSLDHYHREQVEGIKQIKNLNVLSEGKIVIDQCPGRWFIYSYLINNFGVKAIVYSIIKNNRSYLITCIFAYDNFENYKPLFNSTILTFRFE